MRGGAVGVEVGDDGWGICGVHKFQNDLGTCDPSGFDELGEG